MPTISRIYRARDDVDMTRQLLSRTRACVQQSMKLLKETAPDTFLGRDSQNATPLPRQNEGEADD